MRVLVLHDEKAGHRGQANAIILAIAKNFPIEPSLLSCKTRCSAIHRPLEFILNRTGGRLPLRLFHFIHKSDPLSAHAVDLIVSAGGDTRHANAWLGNTWGVPNLFCGETRRLKPSLFAAVITAYERFAGQPPYIVSPTPVAIVREELALAGETFRKRSGMEGVTLWSMLCGGNGGGYQYRDSDWTKLADVMGKISRKSGVLWLITTSRRTGKRAEKILRRALPQDILGAYSFTNIGGATINYTEILGAAERHFCTEDSHMMISEAIASGRPVHTLRPEVAVPIKSNAHFLGIYENNGWISRNNISEAATLDFVCSSMGWRAAPSVIDSLSDKLLEWFRDASSGEFLKPDSSQALRPDPQDTAAGESPPKA
jgi:mitochondrial fission protein ELM1